MLSSITRSFFAAALLCTSSLANPIAFGNPAFAGISFGHPFTISWYGGDGTVRLTIHALRVIEHAHLLLLTFCGQPVSIELLSGNPASLQPVTTLTSQCFSSTCPLIFLTPWFPGNYSGFAVSWTPVPSQSVRAGQLYALSIKQSGLTNYSPMFGISAVTAVSGREPAAYGAPVPIGIGRYYAIANRDVQDHAEVHNSEFGSIFPRQYATGTSTGSGIFHASATGTGTPIGYATGTSTGSINDFRGAAATASPVPHIGEAQSLGLGWSSVVKFLFAGFVSLLLWI
ncbi:MAG: hypothetical protein LQ343_003090 [Gyalolechia ehrenbergii]|nr:MAG: hypothetical protein LQ343_003090 [Gyalolechia ehrenbergii]